jgi:hypothetical protein
MTKGAAPMASTAQGWYSRVRPLATIFRYFVDKKWGSRAPGAPAEAAAAPAAEDVPDYPPWELDPEFLTPPEAPPEPPAAVTGAAPAPPYSSPWATPTPTAAETPANPDRTMTVAWQALAQQTAPLPMAASAATSLPTPARDVTARPPAAPPAPAAPAPTPAPTPQTTSAAARPSGGRHRKG